MPWIAMDGSKASPSPSIATSATATTYSPASSRSVRSPFRSAMPSPGGPPQTTASFRPVISLAFGLTVSGNYFTMLGGQPALGRLLTPEDDVKPRAHAVAVLSEGFWRRQFGGDPKLVGRTIRFNGRPYEVVGIRAKEFVGTQPHVTDFWVPLAMRGGAGLVPLWAAASRHREGRRG